MRGACSVGRKRTFRLIFPSTGETATWKAAGSSVAIAGGACTENKILPAIGRLYIDIFIHLEEETLKKRFLSILLVLCLTLTLLPTVVLAGNAESDGAQLAKLFTDVKAGEAGSGDVTVTIDRDYNLTDYAWTPLTVNGYQGAGVVTVEGNGYTITGLNAPLFAGGFAGTSGIVIKNLTLTGVSIDDSTNNQGIGAFINNVDSMPEIELDNCHLVDSKICSTGGARVGGLIGWTSGYNKVDDGPVDTYITVKNCSVERTAITANGSVGGIIGHAGCNPATFHTIVDNTITGCTLNSTDSGGWRVGVVVGTANVGEISITNTTENTNTLTQTGKTFPEGQSELYGRFVPGTTGKMEIDGMPVFAADIVAAIGNTGFKTLAGAVAAADDNDTVMLLKDSDGAGIFLGAGSKTLTIDLNNHTFTCTGPAVGSVGTQSQALHLEKGNTVTIKNGTICADSNNVLMLVQNYCNLTLDSVSLDATKGTNKVDYVLSNNCGDINITGSTNIVAKSGGKAFDLYYWPSNGYAEGVNVTIDTTGTITGTIEYGSDGSVGAAAAMHDKCKLEIKKGSFNGSISTYACDNNANISISGGLFSSEPEHSYCVIGLTVVANTNEATKNEYPFAIGTLKTEGDNQIEAETSTGETTASVGEGVKADDTEAARAVGESVTLTDGIQDTAGILESEKDQALTALVNSGYVTLAEDGSIPEDTTVSVVKEIYLDVTVTGYDTDNNTVSMDITPKYNLIAVAVTEGSSDTKSVTLKTAQETTVTAPTRVSVVLPEAFQNQKVYIKHKNSIYVAVADANGKVEFTTNGFSPFVFTLYDESVVAEANGNAYTSLQAAADAVNSGDEITVVRDKNLTLTFTATKRVKVTNKTEDTITVTFNGAEKSIEKDASRIFAYTKPSSGSSGVTKIESPNKVKPSVPALTLNTDDHFAFIDGYPDGTVKPTGDVTRAEVAAILYRVMDADCVKTYETTRCSFSDVVRGDWFNLYVATLENAGVIVDTRTNGKFRPNEAITRAELAAMLAQFADIKSAANSFNDVSARHWASDEIAVCAKMGWINGYPDGSFRPDATITRAEMMAMINRALGRTPKSADDLLSGMKTWRDNANVNAWYYLDVQEATNSHTYTKSGSHETWKKLR